MKSISIPYGNTSLQVSVEENRIAGILTAKAAAPSQSSEAQIVRTALANPIQSDRLSALAKDKKRVLLITSDHTRPMPSKITLPLLLAEIRSENPTVEIRILIATGTHRAMTQPEMIERFSAPVVEREMLINHVSTDESAMVFKGRLPSGGALYLNSLVDWADLIVSEGFIEPHFFAGFSGGRKSILPGIASRQSVLYNHNAAFLRDPHATQGVLDSNPLHRDMLHASRVAGLAFILNVILDEEKHIVEAFSGDPEQAHAQGCARCLSRTRVQRIPADIVVTSNGGYPLDQNVYQSVKGMTAAEACVRAGGVIVMCAALGDGAGGDAFYQMLSSANSPAALLAGIEQIPAENTTPDQWEAQILARVLVHATVIFVSGVENKSLIEAMHMKWAASVEDALHAATQLVGAEASIVFIPDGVGVIVSS